MEKIRLENIADELAAEAGLSKAAARRYANFVFQSITEHLAKGDSVLIKSFGTFDTAVYAARPGRNPVTGEAVRVPPKHRIKFSMSRKLLEDFNADGGADAYDAED